MKKIFALILKTRADRPGPGRSGFCAKAAAALLCAAVLCLALPAGKGTFLCLPVSAVQVFAAEDAGEEGTVSADETASQQGGLTIEVVEELSIDDQIIIDDGEVPLANFSEAPADAGPRHAAMMGLVLLCAAGYTLYCSRQEKKLFELRRAAARAQKQSMERG